MGLFGTDSLTHELAHGHVEGINVHLKAPLRREPITAQDGVRLANAPSGHILC